MPKTGHRISKHQMKEDSFVTLAFRAQDYIQHHQKPLIIAFVALVVLVVGSWLWTSAGQRSEVAAEAELGAAFVRVQQQDMAGAAQVYERVISDFGGTVAAREALFYLSNLYFVEKRWQESIEAFDRWARQHGGDDAPRKAASLAAIGDAYQALADYDQSIAAYEEAMGVGGGGFLIGDICIGAARSALLKGDKEAAVGYADRLFESKGNAPSMTILRELLALNGIEYTRGM